MTGRSWLGGLQERARRALPGEVFEYVVTGAGDSTATAEAAARWHTVRFAPQVLRDVTTVDLGVDLLGRPSPVPWAVAPSTLQRAIHPDGELAVARATARAGALMVVSSNAGTLFSEIAATGVRWWLQAYLPADRSLAEPMLAAAVEAGAEAVVLTVDTPVVATKRTQGTRSVWELVDPALLRVNLPAGYEGRAGSEKALDLGPRDLGWLAARTGLPVVVKGVLRGDEALRCVRAGAAAVWVSNHGGRQLDRAAATADCLPEVVESVAGAVEVYVDGGLRSGTDLLAAHALGARACFLGRLPLYALVAGEAGVSRMHSELGAELTEALRLAGCRSVGEAPATLWRPRSG